MKTTIARLTLRDAQQAAKGHKLYHARLVAKGWGHGGYSWYAVTDDGGLLDAKCVRENWRQIVGAALDQTSNGWLVVGHTYDGEMDSPAWCDHCGARLDSSDLEKAAR